MQKNMSPHFGKKIRNVLARLLWPSCKHGQTSRVYASGNLC